ncbi:hypothetical protein HZ994_09275 [Akkermansiaceae bacterium]|nr:hypothetical protein HZ994_09275 [Akkermansiaceae bacterium]
MEIRRGKNAEPPTPELLTDSASRIEAYYRSHGYPLAVVHVSAFGGGSATADDFQFVIREGDPEPSESNKKKHNKAEMATPRKPSD